MHVFFHAYVHMYHGMAVCVCVGYISLYKRRGQNPRKISNQACTFLKHREDKQ